MATIAIAERVHADAPSAAGEVALLHAGAAMDLGGRATQEDALGIFLPGDEGPARRGNLFVLADGLGGHNAGELASRLAVRTIGTAFYSSTLRQPGNLMQSAIEQANRRILVAGQEPTAHGLGSTCVCAVVQGAQLWVANVGDSRAYLLRSPGGLQQLSQDHSLAAEQMRQGILSPAEAADSSMSAVLLQSLGTAGGVQPHFAGPWTLQKGDLVLLCSDGLYGALDERAMADYLSAALLSTVDVNPEHLAHELVEGACFRGATDNVSALVVYCPDVVPDSVARAAGWPQQQARSLLLPQDASAAIRGVSTTLPELLAAVAGTLPAVTAALPPPAPPAVATPAPPLAAPTLPAVGQSFALEPTQTHPAVITLVALAIAAVLLFLLSLVWLWAAFAAPALLVPIFLALAALAVPTGCLLLVSRPRPIAAPAPDRGLPTPAALLPTAADTVLPSTRGLIALPGAAHVDPTPALIAQLLGAPAGAWPGPDRGSAPPVPAPQAPGAPTPPAATPSAPAVAPAPPTLAVPAPESGSPDYVSQAMTAALGRARQQWTFNLLMAAISATLVIGGCILTAVAWLLGQGASVEGLFGPGVGVLGILSWLVTQPAAQLNRADNQISLLTIVWTNYAQELRTCSRLSDPTAIASCNQRAGAEAVQYFNQIVGKN